MLKGLFLENDGHIYRGERVKISSDTNFNLDVLFGNGTFKTIDYCAKRTLSNGCTIRYYLSYFKELYDEDFWSIKIDFPKEISELICKIDKACDWKRTFTEDSILKVFYRYPHICNTIIFGRDFNIDIFDCKNISKTKYGTILSEYEEKIIVEELVNEAIAIIKELVSFKIDTSKLIRKPLEIKREVKLPDWLKTGINGTVRVGAKVLSSYIGAPFDMDFDIGNNGIDNLDIEFNDIGDIDMNDIGDIDMNDLKSDDSNMPTDINNIPFGARNDGTYMKTSQDVNIQSSSGANKGSYDVYLHNGQKYIDFQNQWIKIQGKTRFHLNGNDYIIK